MANNQAMPSPTAKPLAGELPGPPSDDPYCSNCGYPLAGLSDSARCPECGQPLVEVLARRGQTQPMRKCRRFTSTATLFGYPVVSIAYGPRPEYGEKRGVAKGVIALGDVAIGGFAMGGTSVGIISIGGVAVGGAAIGGMSVGLVSALGGAAIGGMAVGGGAAGGLAMGGGAAGIVACGGGAIGIYAAGGGAGGLYTIDTSGHADPEAQQVFQNLSWYFGSNPLATAGSGSFFLAPLVPIGLSTMVLGIIVLLAALVASRRSRDLVEGDVDDAC